MISTESVRRAKQVQTGLKCSTNIPDRKSIESFSARAKENAKMQLRKILRSQEPRCLLIKIERNVTDDNREL